MSDERQQDLLDLAEQAWRGELDLQFEHHPVHRYYPGSCRLADRLLGFKGIAGFYVIDSGDGLVMLDAGHLLDVKRCFEEVRREWPDTPVVAAIYSHHHVDHVFSVTAFDAEAVERGWPRPTVYAHEANSRPLAGTRRTTAGSSRLTRRTIGGKRATDIPTFSTAGT
ncbi:MAG: MBL fold metallo-hydrolase [Acidobacteria bacterium]|nr:MBL fold metallo-hydrolase [Acidobacteriota bacterium]